MNDNYRIQNIYNQHFYIHDKNKMHQNNNNLQPDYRKIKTLEENTLI